MKKTREYWAVENKNHWRRDALWKEDKVRTRDPNTGRVLALLRSVLLALVARSNHQSQPEAMESMARDQSSAIHLIRNQRLI